METNIAGTQPIQPNIINFPNGLIGLENYRQFILKELPDQELFLLLQSVEDDHFGLVVTNPFWFMTDYEFELPDAYAERMRDKTNVDVFVTVSVAATPENITANLMGPILIDRNASVGFQVLSSDKKYTTKYKLMSAKPAGG
jgi:flagellar assembly factor FliW